MLIKVNGLVIREQKVGDSDKYLTLLTKERGRMFVRARGVRKLESRHMAATQLLSFSEFTLFQTKNYTSLNEAVVRENFYGIRLDVAKLALASYFAELAESIAVEAPDEGLMHLTLNALYLLCYSDREHDFIKAVYELRALSLSGFMPELHQCCVCAQDLTAGGWFDVLGGGVECEACRATPRESGETAQRRLIYADADALAAMRHVTWSEPERMFSFKIKGEAAAAFRRICEEYALAQVGREVKTLAMYKALR